MVGILLLLALALATANPSLAQDRQEPVKIGVLAERGTERCLEKWGPTAEYLTEQIPGCSFVIVPLSHDEVCPTVERGEVDFVLADSSLYVEAEACYGVNRLATLKNPRLAGVFSVYGGLILCRADREDIQELSDLKGETFMAVQETSLGGWRAVWRELKAKGIDPHRDFTELLFGGTHDAVIYAVRDGKVTAGCVRTGTLEHMTMEGKIRREQFRVLNEHSWDEYPFLNSTPMYPEWPFAKVAHTSDELAEKVTVALLRMPADSPAAKAARCAGWTVPLNYQPVHECLKELRVGPYEDFGEMTLRDFVGLYWSWIVAAAVFLAIAAITTLWLLRLNRKLSRIRLDLSHELSERKHAEEALRESEERHRAIMETAQDAVITADAEGNIRFWNPAAEKIFGFSAAEALGKNMMDIIVPPQYHEAKRKGLAEFGRTGHGAVVGKTVELTALRKDGSELPIEISISGYRDREGFRGVALIRDISDRKRGEEALRGSEERFRSLVETTSDWVWEVDQNGAYTYVSPQVAGLLGYEPEDVIGKTALDLMPADEAERVGRLFAVVVESRKPFAALENTNLHRDGRQVVLETNGVPFFDADGNLLGYRGVARDITQRKRAEEELQKAHAETKRLLESIPSILIGVGDDERVAAWNATAEGVLGTERGNAIGRAFDDLGIEWDHAAIARTIAECRARNRPVRLDEVRFKRSDGTEGFLGITMNPISSGADKSAGFLLVAADITEQKILQYQWAQSQKLESIGQLAAGIAHEINTPTQFVGDNARFLQDAFGDLRGLLDKYARLADAGRTASVTPEILAEVDAAAKEADLDYLNEQIPLAIAQAIEGVERVAKIVRAMKDFSHPGGEGMQPVDLNRAIESTITVARNEWKYVAEMVTDFDPALPPVVCHIGDFNQVILNIVINAAHAIAGVVGDGAAGKGTITVSTRQNGDWAEIRIRDTGTGIPPEHRSKVFDHFFTTKEVGKGTGQGLAIAYSVVTEKHGGTITFETEMGKGTTFVIRLPIKHESAAPKETPHHEEAYSLR